MENVASPQDTSEKTEDGGNNFLMILGAIFARQRMLRRLEALEAGASGKQ